jgi:23S rRNA (guanosine2251-2'-O)-methyltransferase
MSKTTMYLYGKNSVNERLKANPSSIQRIFVQDNFDAPGIIALIRSKNIELRTVSEKELLRIKRADRLQGIVAEVDRFVYSDFEEIIYSKEKNNLSFLFLDSINDPHNLGSVMRIAACFGGFGIVIPLYGSCQVNETVIHVASGGENFVPICVVNNMTDALIKAKGQDYWIVGAMVGEGEELSKVKLPLPLCLVLGSEGKGVRAGIRKQFEMSVTLPMKGARLSFNVAMASAIFCHEIAKQRG